MTARGFSGAARGVMAALAICAAMSATAAQATTAASVQPGDRVEAPKPVTQSDEQTAADIEKRFSSELAQGPGRRFDAGGLSTQLSRQCWGGEACRARGFVR